MSSPVFSHWLVLFLLIHKVPSLLASLVSFPSLWISVHPISLIHSIYHSHSSYYYYYPTPINPPHHSPITIARSIWSPFPSVSPILSSLFIFQSGATPAMIWWDWNISWYHWFLFPPHWYCSSKSSIGCNTFYVLFLFLSFLLSIPSVQPKVNSAICSS